jgi:hypothetical protein
VWVDLNREHALRPGKECVDFIVGQQGSEAGAEIVWARDQTVQIREEGGGDGVADELPENGAEFWERIKGEPVIYPPELAMDIAEAVAQLTIGVVGEVVEEDNPLDVE